MKMRREYTVVAVDDDEINLMILVKGITDAGCVAKPFHGGEAAWDYIQAMASKVDIVVLDKMMPGMSGLELLSRIKNDPRLRHIPVIMQTGDAGVAQMRECLDTGALYYLSKPFHPEILTSILNAAISECQRREDLLRQMSAQQSKLIHLVDECELSIVTHEDAYLVAAVVAQAAIYPEFVAIGLMELLANAIEHGNLEIGGNRKRKAMLSNGWEHLLAERHADPLYKRRCVRMRLQKISGGLHVIIIDEGHGFDWQHYLYGESTLNLHEPGGRGISKALVMLDDLRYTGRGNEVHCKISLPAYLPAGQEAGISLRES